MSNSIRRIIALAVGGALLMVLMAGCTLAGAEAAPPEQLTPVGNIASPTPLDGGAGQDGEGDVAVIPSPTESTGPIDVFGTQTAVAGEAVTGGEESGTGEIPPEGGEVTPEDGTGENPPEGGEVTPDDGGEVAETPESTPTPLPDEPAGDTPPPATSPVVDCPDTHTIQPGENLYRIALKYGITTAELAEANGITNPDSIKAGTVLKIPYCKGSSGEQFYVVQPGDTLYRIALKFGVNWQELAAYNGISNPDALVPGQVLRIPPRS